MFTEEESADPITQAAVVCVLGLIEEAAKVAQTPTELSGRAVAAGEAVAAGLRALRDEARKVRGLDPEPAEAPKPFVDPADHPIPEPPPRVGVGPAGLLHARRPSANC